MTKRLTTKSKILVIGSGITGLASGALFAKAGYAVTLLEANAESFGGHARSFQRDGFWFCAGPQYLWNFTEGAIGKRVLDYLEISNKVPIESMNPSSFERCLVADQNAIDIPMGFDRFKEMLILEFPEEKKTLCKFFNHLKDITDACTALNNKAAYQFGASQILSELVFAKNVSATAKIRTALMVRTRLSHLFEKFRFSQALRRILYAHGGIFLENESAVSAVAYGASTGFYHKGASFPSLGFRSLVEGLRDVIVESGGSIAKGRRVTKLRIRKEEIVSVECADGESLPADFVISNISPRLLATTLSSHSEYLQSNYTPSHSVISLFLGVKDYSGFRSNFDRRNIWWQDGKREVEYHEPDMSRSPRMMYLCSPTCNGEGNRNENPDSHSIMVFSPGNYLQAKRSFDQGEVSYNELRKSIVENHIAAIEKFVLPDLKRHLLFYDLHTPLETETEIWAEQGSVYGRRGTPKSLLKAPIRQNRLKNLVFACATTGAAGIASGIQTAAVLLENEAGIKI